MQSSHRKLTQNVWEERPDDEPEYPPNDLVLPIDRRVLLQFLMEAVEEVQA